MPELECPGCGKNAPTTITYEPGFITEATCGACGTFGAFSCWVPEPEKVVLTAGFKVAGL